MNIFSYFFDVVPTICHLVGNRMPKDVEGGVIYQALAEN